MTRARKGKVVSLFSGALGLDLGLEKAGFEVAVALESNRVAIETIQANRPSLPVIPKRIEDVPTAEILETAGISREEVAVVSGGPSCQAFSTAGRRRSLGDPRGNMFMEFVRVVREVRPRFFVMENVKGLLSAAVRHRPLKERGPGYPPLSPDEELGSAFRLIADELRSLGYYVVFDVVNAADFGVPQVRRRLVFIGSRDGEPVRIPERTHHPQGVNGYERWAHLREAIWAIQRKRDHSYYHFCPSKARYLSLVPEGSNWRSLPRGLQEEALGKAFVSWGGRSGFFRRLAWDEPSPALTTRPDSKATSLCHPTELRPLSVEEYARIQQFDDGWWFAGSVRQQYEQVGNAVPLGLGQAIGQTLRDAMKRRRRVGRFGVVECWNAELIRNLTKSPRSVANPPRMRKVSDPKALTRWYQGRGRYRADAIAYAAPEILPEVEGRPKAKRSSGQPERCTRDEAEAPTR